MYEIFQVETFCRISNIDGQIQKQSVKSQYMDRNAMSRFSCYTASPILNRKFCKNQNRNFLYTCKEPIKKIFMVPT